MTYGGILIIRGRLADFHNKVHYKIKEKGFLVKTMGCWRHTRGGSTPTPAIVNKVKKNVWWG